MPPRRARVRAPRSSDPPHTLLARPRKQAVEGGVSRRIERCPGSADGGALQNSTAAEHLLAERHPDALLELEAHQRHVPIERVRGIVDPPSVEQTDDFDQHPGKRETRYGARRTRKQLLEQINASQAAQDGERSTLGLLENLRGLERGRRIFELDDTRLR